MDSGLWPSPYGRTSCVCRRCSPRCEPYSQCAEAFGWHGVSIERAPIQRLQEKGHVANNLLRFAVMGKPRKTHQRPLGVLLAIAFLAAQIGVFAHAYEHDPGSPQAQVCLICVAGHSLSSACVASTVHIEFQHCNTGVSIERTSVPDTIHLPYARQRAPPTPL